MNSTKSYMTLILAIMLIVLAGCGSSSSTGAYGLLPPADYGQNADNPVEDVSVISVTEPAPLDQALVETPKQWSEAADMLDSGAGDGSWMQKVATDRGGSAVVVWIEYVDGVYAVMANRFIAGLGWQEVVRLDSAGGGDASGVTVAAGCEGHAIVAWHKLDGSTYTAYASILDPAAGWSGEVVLGVGGMNPSAAMDTSGNAIVVWKNRNGETYDILGAYHSVNGDWSAIATIDNDGGTASSASVAFLTNGDAVAVWQQYINWSDHVLAAKFDTATGAWESPVLLENGSGRAMYPSIVADKGTGGAMAVWNQEEYSRYTVMASLYDPATGWGVAHDMADGVSGYSYDAHVDFDANGNAIAVWYNYERGKPDSIFFAYYSSTAGWTQPAVLQSGGDNIYLSDPKVKFAPNGKALAVWNMYDGDHTGLMTAWFDATDGWSAPEHLDGPLCECGMPREIYRPELSIDCAGNVTLTWVAECYCDCGCSPNVYAIRYS